MPEVLQATLACIKKWQRCGCIIIPMFRNEKSALQRDYILFSIHTVNKSLLKILSMFVWLQNLTLSFLFSLMEVFIYFLLKPLYRGMVDIQKAMYFFMHTTWWVWREVYVCEIIPTIYAINIFITSQSSLLPFLLSYY